MNIKNETKDEQLNIRLSQSTLDAIHEDMKQFGGNISQSAYGELALKYFGRALKEKGALAILSEVL